MPLDINARAFRAMRLFSIRESVGSAPAEGLAPAYWCGRVAELEQSFLYTDAWTLAEPDSAMRRAKELGSVLFALRRPPAGGDAVVAMDRATLFLYFGQRGRLQVSLAAESPELAMAAIERVRAVFPKEKAEGCRVVIKQWTYRYGGRSHAETIDVCAWDHIRSNYHRATRAGLEPLMRTPNLTSNGKLALWLGPPGTGKTWAIRALAWEQRASMQIHYVLDPEVLLDRPDYVMAVFRGDDFGDEDDERPVERRARLIVLEDAGELLGADAMARTGHGLSRLLNLTDGLPGQGSRNRILITTNEDVGRLHPAVTRPGRCAALVRFAPLDDGEARAWLAERNGPAPERPSRTLAELYEALSGGTVALPEPRRPAGFHVGDLSTS